MSYAGIDKHQGESVGGWDTVLHLEEYEALYNKQQATIGDFESVFLPEKYLADKKIENKIAIKNEIDVTDAVSMKEDDLAEKELAEILAKVKVGCMVTHKKFVEGIVTWMDNAKKYVRVKFSVGEKNFVFPNAFLLKFLELKN